MNTIQILPVRDILQTNYGKDEWLVESLIPLQTATILSGTQESYKSFVSLHLALCVAEGKAFLGEFPVPFKRNVLILDKENQGRHLQKRLQSLDVPSDSPIWYSFNENAFLDNEEYFDSLINAVREQQISLVIFDALIRFHAGDENDAKHMSKVLGKIKELISETGVNVILIHHHRKENFGRTNANSLRGSTDITAAVDSILSIEFKDGDDVLVFNHLKSRQAEKLKPFAAKLERNEEEKKLAFKYVGTHDRNKEKRDEAVEAILQYFEGAQEESVGRSQIHEAFKGSYSQTLIDSALAILVADGILLKETKGRGAHFYSLNRGESNSSVENSLGFSEAST